MYCVNTPTDVAWSSSLYTDQGTGALSRKGLFTCGENIIEKEWRNKFIELNQIRSLTDDWDGEGALSPTPELVDSVTELLKTLQSGKNVPPPSRIVVTPEGSTIVEWQTNEMYFEAEISTPYHAECMVELPDSTFEHFEQSWEPIAEDYYDVGFGKYVAEAA